MFIRRKYRLRHKLLRIILDKHDEIVGKSNFHKTTVNAENIAIPLPVLCVKMAISIEELKTITPPLIMAEEIKLEDFGKGIAVFAWINSQSVYDDEKYLEIGKKKFNDDIYDITKWTLPFIAVLFAAFTTLTNLSLHKDIDYTKQEIKVLKKELDSLKEL
ncbi:hypothetical protein, partial [Ferruginibacter sp.]|uniref:hypothetical protein n=1 Tax=Ferruginibacter sp. TaxID=1940288 RepID=UPI0019872FE5